MTQRWHRPFLIVILLVAFALRLTDLTRQNIWWDEARNIDVALRTFSQIATAPELDIQPPLYYWLLHGWLAIAGVQMNDDPTHIAFFARFLSVVAGVLGVALMPALTSLCFAPRNEQRRDDLSQITVHGSRITHHTPQFTTLLATLSPFWLAESQETRMYTVGMLWLMAAAVVWLRDWRLEIGDWRLETRDQRPETSTQAPKTLSDGVKFAIHNSQLATFTILSALVLLTHYNALFILVAWYGWWGVWAILQTERWRHLWQVTSSGVLTLLFVLPIIPIALRQIPTYENPNLIVPTVADYLRQNWVAYLGGYAFDPALLRGNGAYWLWGVLVVAVVGLIVGQRKESTKRREGEREKGGKGENTFTYHASRITHLAARNSQFATRNSAFPLIWLFGGLALYYIAVMDRGAFNVRYASFVTPALYMLIGAGLAGWSRGWRPLGWIAAVLLLTGLIPAIRNDLRDPRFFREDTQGLATWLRQTTQPGDLILVDQKYPMGFYYKRFVIDPGAHPVGTESVDARYLFVDINTVDQRFNVWAQHTKRVFWVQWFESDTDPRRAVPFLLNQQGRHLGTQPFQGYVVDWWELSPPNQFTLAPTLTPLQIRVASAVETIEQSLPTTFISGVGVPVVIRWQRVADGSADRPLKARVALYDASDTRVAQADERLLNDRHLMPPFWAPSDQPLNLYWLDPPADLPLGKYTLRLLIYDADSTEALPLFDLNGAPRGIEVHLGEIRKTL